MIWQISRGKREWVGRNGRAKYGGPRGPVVNNCAALCVAARSIPGQISILYLMRSIRLNMFSFRLLWHSGRGQLATPHPPPPLSFWYTTVRTYWIFHLRLIMSVSPCSCAQNPWADSYLVPVEGYIMENECFGIDYGIQGWVLAILYHYPITFTSLIHYWVLYINKSVFRAAARRIPGQISI